MGNAKEYYDKHSYGYTKKWLHLSKGPMNPSEYYRKQLMGLTIEMSNITKDDKVIEIGCGSGLVLREILKITNQVYGTDISLEMIRRVKDSVLKDKRVTIVNDFLNLDKYKDSQMILSVNDFLDLQIPSNYFTKILSIEVLRYIENKEKCLENIKQVMKEASLFTFTVTNFWSFSFFPIKYTIRKLLGLVKDSELKQYFLTEHSIKRDLKAKGFEIVKFRRYGLLTVNKYTRKLIRNESLFNKVYKIDTALSRIPVINFLFDTYIITVKKKELNK